MRRLLVLAPTLLAFLALATPAHAGEAVAEDDAIVVISGDVTVERDQTTEGVYVVRGDTRIAGAVDGDVVVLNGKVTVLGRIDGDLVALTGRSHLLPGASVTGDVIYADDRPRVARGATVGGTVEKADWGDSLGVFSLVTALVFWLAMSISAAVLGILLLLIAPRAADAIYGQVEERFWTAVAIGVAIFIVLPVAAFVTSLTLLGLPLALALALALLPLAAIAYVTAAWALGRVILRPPQQRILAFLAGLAILRVLALIPILGALVWLGAVIVGLGLLGAALMASREPSVAGAQGT